MDEQTGVVLAQATETHPDSTIHIRPLVESDRAALVTFGASLPEDDVLYLESDFRSADTINRLVNAAAAENWRQVVAVADGRIVGYAAARRLPGWSNHVADLSLLVDSEWRRSGVGTELARAVFALARELGTAKVIVEILAEQRSGQDIFTRLGFVIEGRLSSHARTRNGSYHDLLIMAYNVS